MNPINDKQIELFKKIDFLLSFEKHRNEIKSYVHKHNERIQPNKAWRINHMETMNENQSKEFSQKRIRFSCKRYNNKSTESVHLALFRKFLQSGQ